MIDCTPQIHVAAIHAEAGYRSEVPGLGILCVKEDLILSAGRYSNSVGTMSNYAVVGTYLGTISGIRYGIVGGTVNGYAATNGGDYMPMAAAVATIPLNGFNIHLTMVPRVPNYTPAFVQFSITF